MQPTSLPAVNSTADSPPDRRTIIALMVALLAACLAFQLNASMLAPALVTVEVALDATSAEVALTQTAFFTSAALCTLFLPRLGDLIGRRKVLVGMLVVTAIGCVVAALATNVTTLFIGRLIQGASGPVIPLCLVMLRHLVTEPKIYGTLLGVLTAINGGIAGFDALLGGWLASNYGFESIFWVMTGIALGAAVLIHLLAGESTAAKRGRMDWRGSILLVISVGSMLVAVNELGKLASANFTLVTVLIVVAAGAFWLFWRTEGRSAHPLVSISQLKQRATWSTTATSLLTLSGVFAIMNGIVPALAQDAEVGLGMTAEETSWWILMPYAIAGLLMGPIAGRLAAIVGYRTMLRIGLIGTIIGILLFALNAGGGSRTVLLFLSIAVGITYAGIGNIMLNGLGVVLSPKESPGSLPGLNTGGINLGAGVSFVLIYTAQTAFTPAEGHSTAGYIAGMLTGAVILIGALAMSTLIPRPSTAEITK